MLEVGSVNRSLTVDAPAKVNLTLRVLGRRPDGYHELESVVAAVALCDTLLLEPSYELRLICRGTDVPAGEDNLVMRAARALAKQAGVKAGGRITLEKRIPAGRGFGGGSSDAAAALAGLNVLWNTNLERGDLARLGATIGSDVPLFFGSPVSVMRGRGELIEPIAGRPPWRLVLAWPDFGSPTPEVYAEYDRQAAGSASSPGGGSAGGQHAGGRPRATEIVKHFGARAREAGEFLVNDLEAPARGVGRGRMDVRAILEAAGAGAVGMTGSGSAYFALADSEAEARQIAEATRTAGAAAEVTFILGPGHGK